MLSMAEQIRAFASEMVPEAAKPEPAADDPAGQMVETGRGPGRLLVLNGLLLAALAGVTLAVHVGSGPAVAQPIDPNLGTPIRNRGDYTIVSGRYQGGTTSAVYVLDASNQQLLALTWDRTNSRFNLVGLRSLIDDARFQRAPR